MTTGLRNNLCAEQELREAGRGRMLDVHRGETGLQQQIVPGQRVDLIQLASDNRANPRIVTVGVDVTEQNAAADNVNTAMNLKTLLSWGTGKGVSEAIIDTRIGGQITLSANILNVAVEYTGTEGAVFLVSGSVSYGNRPGAGNPALTFTDELIALLAGVESARRQIPDYAVAVAWTTTLGVLPAARISFFGAAAATSPTVALADVAQNVFIPITNGAYFATITNTSVNDGDYRLIYEVVL